MFQDVPSHSESQNLKIILSQMIYADKSATAEIIWQGKAGGKGTTGSGPAATQQAPPSGLQLPLTAGQQDFWSWLVA